MYFKEAESKNSWRLCSPSLQSQTITYVEGVKTFGADDKNNEGKMNVKEKGNLRPFFNSEKTHITDMI